MDTQMSDPVQQSMETSDSSSVRPSPVPQISILGDELVPLSLEESTLKRTAPDAITDSTKVRKKKRRSSLATKRRSITGMVYGSSDSQEMPSSPYSQRSSLGGRGSQGTTSASQSTDPQGATSQETASQGATSDVMEREAVELDSQDAELASEEELKTQFINKQLDSTISSMEQQINNINRENRRWKEILSDHQEKDEKALERLANKEVDISEIPEHILNAAKEMLPKNMLDLDEIRKQVLQTLENVQFDVECCVQDKKLLHQSMAHFQRENQIMAKALKEAKAQDDSAYDSEFNQSVDPRDFMT